MNEVTISHHYSQGNPVCFISRLPIETLADIFILCACEYYTEATGAPISTLPSWVNVSYVSRHWRNVALNRPTLWTYLLPTSSRWTEELLVRSKQVSLKVHVNLCVPEPIRSRGCRFLEQLTDHVERIQELCLHLPRVPGSSVLSKLPASAPRLQKLRIYTRFHSADWTQIPFGGDTPALRILELTLCPMHCNSFKLSRLTMLSLRNVPTRFQPNVVDFLATLSCMQDLTYLYLRNALASATGFLSSAAFKTFQTIDLPNLSRLRIVAPVSTVAAFLYCTNVPLKTEVRLKCDPNGVFPTLDDCSLFFSLPVQRFGMSTPIIRSLVIEHAALQGREILTFSTSDRYCDPSAIVPNWGRNIPLEISLPCDRPIAMDNADHIISGICCSIPMTNVQSVHAIDPPQSSVFWSKILWHLQDLRYLKLSEGTMLDLANVLSLPPCNHTENPGGHADQVLAPALEELELYNMKFMSELQVQPLYDALSSRKGSRGKFTMVQCAVVKRDDSAPGFGLDMIGRWESGRFHIIE